MKIDKIRIEKKKHETNINKKFKNKIKCRNYKKGMETNETRKGKYSKIILKEKKLQK
jgi:hypothetical protein